jgi:hypothetical protein
MEIQDTKIIGLGAAIAAGLVSAPLLGQIDKATGGKWLYLSGGAAVVAGLGLGYFGRHPAFQGLGYGLAAMGAFTLVADYQASAASGLASTATAGWTGWTGGPTHMVMSAGQPTQVVGTNGRRYNLPEQYYPSVKSTLPPTLRAIRQYAYD